MVLQGELDRCPAPVRAALDVRDVHDSGISGLPAARNGALELVTTDIVLFLDDDVHLEPDFIERLAATYRQEPSVTGASGIVTNYRRPPLLFRLWSVVFVRGPFYDDRQRVYWNAARLQAAGPVRVSRLGGGLI